MTGIKAEYPDIYRMNQHLIKQENNMKIAFTAKGKDWDSMIDPRFGRTDYIVIYDEEAKSMEAVDNTETVNQQHGAGPLTAKKLIELNPDVLITGNGPGGNASAVLKTGDYSIYTGAGQMTVKGAYIAYKNNELTKTQI